MPRRKYTRENFWEHVDKSGDCWLWLASAQRGTYGYVNLPGFTTTRAHRVAYELTYGGPIPGDLFVCHHCDNPPCVRPEHLFLGTRSDNANDMMRKYRDKPSWYPPDAMKRREVLALLGITLRGLDDLLWAGELQAYPGMGWQNFYLRPEVEALRKRLAAQR